MSLGKYITLDQKGGSYLCDYVAEYMRQPGFVFCLHHLIAI
jgi:hypothetical protein